MSIFNFKGALARLDDEFYYLLEEFGASLQQKKNDEEVLQHYVYKETK